MEKSYQKLGTGLGLNRHLNGNRMMKYSKSSKKTPFIERNGEKGEATGQLEVERKERNPQIRKVRQLKNVWKEDKYSKMKLENLQIINTKL